MFPNVQNMLFLGYMKQSIVSFFNHYGNVTFKCERSETTFRKKMLDEDPTKMFQEKTFHER